MHTLQEFIEFTKQWEYLTAIGAVFLFIGFWKLLSGAMVAGEKRGEDAQKPAL